MRHEQRSHEPACQRAREALRAGKPELALAEADAAIELVLQHGLRVPEFLSLARRSAPSEILFRYERRAVARSQSLHLPLALRWEALRRAGRSAEAREMRSVLLRLFPERASVWAEAGNHALDEQDLPRAEQYFERCLSLAPDWTAALAGKAILAETCKQWDAALEYRRRVVEVERALSRDDAPSLQRTLRYAAALGRVGRWDEAAPLFRRCALRGAFAQLPAERPVLARVFSRELYAPAMFALLATEPQTPEAQLALHEASVFGALYGHVLEYSGLERAERLVLLGMCAWLAGDYERAYALLDEAEDERDVDLCLACLLAWSARAAGASDCESVERFALESAAAGGAAYFAQITLSRLGGGVLPEPLPAPSDEADVIARLRALVALRARSSSQLEAALASTEALAALQRALAATSPSGPRA